MCMVTNETTQIASLRFFIELLHLSTRERINVHHYFHMTRWQTTNVIGFKVSETGLFPVGSLVG